MIKKILGIFILLIIIIFLALYVAVDKILIKNTISNIEKKLNLNINLLEDYSFNNTSCWCHVLYRLYNAYGFW